MLVSVFVMSAGYRFMNLNLLFLLTEYDRARPPFGEGPVVMTTLGDELNEVSKILTPLRS